MITSINESKTLAKHIACKYICKFDGTKCKSNQCWNKDNVDVNKKNITCVKKIKFGILLHVVVKIENIWQILWMIHLLFVMKLQGHMIKK